MAQPSSPERSSYTYRNSDGKAIFELSYISFFTIEILIFGGQCDVTKFKFKFRVYIFIYIYTYVYICRHI